MKVFWEAYTPHTFGPNEILSQTEPNPEQLRDGSFETPWGHATRKPPRDDPPAHVREVVRQHTIPREHALAFLRLESEEQVAQMGVH